MEHGKMIIIILAIKLSCLHHAISEISINKTPHNHQHKAVQNDC